MTEEEMWAEAMEGVMQWEKQTHESVNKILQEYNIPWSDLEELLDGSSINGMAEVVDKPRGDKNNESFGALKDIHVDQWSVGDSGDSYAGFIYAKIQENVWIKIPYEC